MPEIDFSQQVQQVIDTRKREPILVERERTHGIFQHQGAFAYKLKMQFRQGSEHMRDDQREALDMIATKISRLLFGDPNHKDTWEDISGYAKLGAEACE